MQVLVTRPEPEAARWVADLRSRGLDALALPLIDIGPAPDLLALRAAQEALPGQQAVMFVSVNAVRGFFAGAQLHWPAGTGAWAPGAGTAAALREAGVPASGIATPPRGAAQWDSEHLWPVVAAQVQPGFRLLVVRGADREGRPAGRDWLAGQVEAAGGTVSSVAAYVRRLPGWSAAQRLAAERAQTAECVWLFSSSEALRHLAELMPQADWSQPTALATHPRIAENAARLGFAHVRTTAPTLAAVVASIESLR